ncbi:MAG: helix-turn-helix domain-containing protein [Candidatus Nanoarchaeia archaeon]|nr:helix-turn-helix domain-containing protein [Candidatus Nanoarchaeia archaeon]
MDTNRMLENLGLTEQEIKVYVALLELGPSLAGRITRKAGIHRRNVYDITERLIKKGMIGYILKNNRRLFEAANPEVFLDIVKREEARVLESLPFLRGLYEKTKEKQETNFYKGVNGLKTVFQDQLEDNKGKEVLILGASRAAFEILPFYFKWYDKDRVRMKIKAKIIASEEMGKRIPFSEIRYLPEKYANPLAVNIYKDKVALILWKKEPIAIVIREKEAADAYRKYFEVMWRVARKR